MNLFKELNNCLIYIVLGLLFCCANNKTKIENHINDDLAVKWINTTMLITTDSCGIKKPFPYSKTKIKLMQLLDSVFQNVEVESLKIEHFSKNMNGHGDLDGPYNFLNVLVNKQLGFEFLSNVSGQESRFMESENKAFDFI